MSQLRFRECADEKVDEVDAALGGRRKDTHYSGVESGAPLASVPR